MRLPLLFSWCLLLAGPGCVAAAESTILVQKVAGTASAGARTVLPPGTPFRTGAQSQSELTNDRGVVRVGENAELETGPKGVVLRRGVTLVASHPGRLRSTLEVRAPGYHLRVKGTAQVAYEPGRSLKVVALEGEITVSLDSLTGEFETLKPGQLLIINPGATRLPEPVEIDLNRLLATSSLTGGRLGALPTASRLAASAAGQASAYASGALGDTSLLLRGLDNAVEIDRSRLGEPAAVSSLTTAQRQVRLRPGLSNPDYVATSKFYTFSDGSNKATSLVDFTFARNSSNLSRTRLLMIELTEGLQAAPVLGGRVTVAPDLFGATGRELRFVLIDPDPLYSRLRILPQALVFTPALTALTFEPSYGLDVSGATLTAGLASSEAETLALIPDSGGMTIHSSSLAGGRVVLEGGVGQNRIDIATSRVGAKGALRIGSTANPSSLSITDSSALRSLAGNVDLLVRRGDITLDQSGLEARQGAITIDAFLKSLPGDGTPQALPGAVVVQNTTSLTARAIRLRGFANGGNSLVIDNSTLAAQSIKLFAEGASTLYFKNTVLLHTPLAVLAGKTVEVDPRGKVTVTGAARVYTDDARFNKPGYGDLKSKGDPTLKGFSAREGF